MNFNMEDRLIFNAQESREKTEKFVRNIQSICSDIRLDKLLSEKDKMELDSVIERIEKHSSENLKVVVAGDFKRGKSTFINSLLGENVLPTNITPETVTINHIIYREENGIEAVLKNGMRLKLSDDEITRERIEQIMEQVPAPIERLEIYRNLPILKELTFVDTPGLGETETGFSETVAEMILCADVVIYLVSALSPLSLSEQAFLNAAVYPQKFSKTFVVINMADSLDSAEDCDRVKERVENMIYAADPSASVCILSALDECCRKMGKSRPNIALSKYLEDHYEAFTDLLVNDIITQKDMIKVSRLTSLESNTIDKVEVKINGIIKMLDVDGKKLEETESGLYEKKLNVDKELEDTRTAITEFVNDRKKEANVWIGEFLDRMKVALTEAKTQAKGQEVQKHLSFYISDKTKEAFNSCLEVHSTQLDEMLKEQINSINDVKLSGSFEGSFVRLKDISWTNVDAAAYFGGLVANYFGTSLSVLVEAGFGFVRQKKIEKSQQNVLDPVIENFSSISKQVYEQLDETYDSYANKSISIVEEYYRQSIDDALATINNAKARSVEFSERGEEIREDMQSLLSSLSRLRENL